MPFGFLACLFGTFWYTKEIIAVFVSPQRFALHFTVSECGQISCLSGNRCEEEEVVVFFISVIWLVLWLNFIQNQRLLFVANWIQIQPCRLTRMINIGGFCKAPVYVSFHPSLWLWWICLSTSKRLLFHLVKLRTHNFLHLHWTLALDVNCWVQNHSVRLCSYFWGYWAVKIM